METTSVGQRVDNHELRLNALEVKMAINETNTDNLGEKLDKIDANISKLTWIIITAVVLAVLGLVLKGGPF